MKPPAEDLERRRPVWKALSAVFIDTEIDEAWRDEIADCLRSSGYSASELESILWGELCPVLHVNLLSFVGEWTGFDMGFVERRILDKPAGRFRRWLSYLRGGKIARHEWKRIKQVMAVKHAK